jgi:acylphosphatase
MLVVTGGCRRADAIKALRETPRLWLHAGAPWPGGGKVPRAGEQKNSRLETRRVMNRSRLHVFYSGNVQGVGFRYTVKTLAGGFELTGTVRNLPDGRVELLAEGSRDELGAFQQAIRESELGHFIRREDVTWAEPAGGLRGFEIAS